MKRTIAPLWTGLSWLLTMTVIAQPIPKSNRLFATGYLGPATSIGAASPHLKIGLQGNTGIEYRLTPTFWLTGGLNFDIYTFNRTDKGITIRSSVGLANVGLSATYCPLPRARWRPYVSGGAGGGYLSGPSVQADFNRQQVDVTSQGSFYPVFQAGVGVQRLLFSNLTGFVEGAYEWVPTVRYADIGLLQLASIRIGIKSPISINRPDR